MKTFRPMPAVEGVSPGGIATLRCPIGLTYHGLLFTMTGTTFDISHLTEIRVKGNGKEIWTARGQDLEKMNTYEGRAPSNGQFFLDFERYGLDNAVGRSVDETIRGREVTAIGTGVAPSENNPIQLSTLQVEADISTSASAPFLSAKALQSGSRNLGLLKKRRQFTYTASGAITLEISDLPTGDVIDKIFILSSNGNLTRLRLERNNFLSFDRTVDENNNIQIDGIRNPQSKMFVLDPSERGRGDEGIVTAGVNDFRLKLTTSGSDTFIIYVDYLGGLGGN